MEVLNENYHIKLATIIEPFFLRFFKYRLNRIVGGCTIARKTVAFTTRSSLSIFLASIFNFANRFERFALGKITGKFPDRTVAAR
jgi:hypothetical protein